VKRSARKVVSCSSLATGSAIAIVLPKRATSIAVIATHVLLGALGNTCKMDSAIQPVSQRAVCGMVMSPCMEHRGNKQESLLRVTVQQKLGVPEGAAHSW
jgi:hypothetical protein